MVTSASLVDPKSYEPQPPLCGDCKWLGDECLCGCGWGYCGRDGHWVEIWVDSCDEGRER